MRERIDWKDLGLKEGDCLTFSDGVTSIEIVSIGGSMLMVRPKQDKKGRPCALETITHRLMRDHFTSETDVYGVWTFCGETLRTICTRKVADCPAKKSPKAVRRDKWLKTVRADGNLFFLEASFRFTRVSQ